MVTDRSHDDLKILKKRLADDLVARAQRRDLSLVKDAQRDLDRLQPVGHWVDIDYQDQSLMGEWRSATHLHRLFEMAAASRLSQPGAADPLAAGTLNALNYWLERDFRNPNWWWNEIGVPKRLGEVMVLMEDRLTAAQLAAGLKIMSRNDWSKHTGQNLVWGVTIQILRGVLAGSPAEVAEGVARMADEIRIARPGREGIQADYSFHQHEAVLYSGGYGLGFACDCSTIAALIRGTSWAFQLQTVSLLSAYLLDGQQWMIRGHTFDYSAVGREITRRGKSATGLAEACADMELVDAVRRTELAAFRRRLQGEAGPDDALAGNRHFWKSDLMTHHRPEYYASVHMFSNRMDSTDWVCGGEGKKSHYLADGATFLYRTGDEYRDIFPVWDWRRVPGTTVEYVDPHPGPDTVRTRGTRSFVGGVSDGEYGMAAMDFQRGSLSARKAWFFFDREFVCLGAGIACTSEHPVRTSVAQCLARGEVTSPEGLGKGLRTLRSPAWVSHDGVTYLFLKPAEVCVGTAEQQGDWAEIGTGIDGRVSASVFNLWIEHGRGITDGEYAYVVVPDGAGIEVTAYARDLPLAILANRPQLQAVRHTSLGITQAAFHEAGKLAVHDQLTMSVDRPCLLQIRETAGALQLTVANPENRPSTVHVEISLPLRGRGCRGLPDRPLSQITLRLPGGRCAGKSVSRRLTRM